METVKVASGHLAIKAPLCSPVCSLPVTFYKNVLIFPHISCTQKSNSVKALCKTDYIVLYFTASAVASAGPNTETTLVRC